MFRGFHQALHGDRLVVPCTVNHPVRLKLLALASVIRPWHGPCVDCARRVIGREVDSSQEVMQHQLARWECGMACRMSTCTPVFLCVFQASVEDTPFLKVLDSFPLECPPPTPPCIPFFTIYFTFILFICCLHSPYPAPRACSAWRFSAHCKWTVFIVIIINEDDHNHQHHHYHNQQCQ